MEAMHVVSLPADKAGLCFSRLRRGKSCLCASVFLYSR